MTKVSLGLLDYPVAFTARIMGFAALLGIATLLTRLQSAPAATATAPANA